MSDGPNPEEPRPDKPGRRGPPGRRAAERAAKVRRENPPDDAPAGVEGGMRLNKLLASRGIGARRKCDVLISAGSVRVNGTVVKQPGTQVMPGRDRIEVHGRQIPGRATLVYLMLHKPVGVITTLDDPEGRPTVRTLLPPGPRLFPVGRLDAETSGLIIATNDGTLAHHLMHPRYGVRKLYRVRLDRPPDAEQIRRLRTGVEFEPRIVSAPCEVRVRNSRSERAEIDIILHEGRYRQVRRMCEAVGLGVSRLHRPGYGPLKLGTLARGAWRELSHEEVKRLRAASARPVPRVSRAPRVPGAAVSARPETARPSGAGEAAAKGGRRRAPRPRLPRGFAASRAHSAVPGSRSPSTLRRSPAVAATSPARRPGSSPARRPGSSPARRPGSSPARHPGSLPARRPGSSPARRPGSSPAQRRPAAGPVRAAHGPDIRPVRSASARGPRSSFIPTGPAGRPRTPFGGASGPPRRRASPSGRPPGRPAGRPGGQAPAARRPGGGPPPSRQGQRTGRAGPMRPGRPSGRGRPSGLPLPSPRRTARRGPGSR